MQVRGGGKMITLQLLQQIIVFFLMMACGFAVVKRGLIDAKSSKTLSVICIYIIMPCVMINAFQIEYSRSIRNGFLLAVAAAILIHILLLVFVQIIGRPLMVLLMLKYTPLASLVKDGQTILLISLMAVITPSATTVVQLAQLYDEEPVYASTINVMTTIVSIITMPLMVMFYLV